MGQYRKMAIKFQSKLTGRQSTLQFIVDELCARLLSWIYRRGEKKSYRIPPLFCLSSDLITHRLISTGLFESSNLEALDFLLNDKSCRIFDPNKNRSSIFIDVGANIGIFSLRYFRMFKYTVSIEPNPLTFEILKANIKMYGDNSIILSNTAASSSDALMFMETVRGGNIGWSRLEEKLVDGSMVEVATQKLDTILEGLNLDGDVSLIKIDVEGLELEVFKGAVNIIEKYRPIILFENLGCNSEEKFQFLKSLGYNRFVSFDRARNFLYFLNFFLKLPVIVRDYDTFNPIECDMVCAFVQ